MFQTADAAGRAEDRTLVEVQDHST